MQVGDIITQVEAVDEQWIMGVVGGKHGIELKTTFHFCDQGYPETADVGKQRMKLLFAAALLNRLEVWNWKPPTCRCYRECWCSHGHAHESDPVFVRKTEHFKRIKSTLIMLVV